MQSAPASLRRPTVRVALVVLAAVVVLSVAELTSDRFNEFTADHSLISTFITEAVLLVGVYLVIDEIIQRREARRWSDVTSLGTRALSTSAHRPVEIIRRTVDELAELDSGEAARSASVDYREFVSAHADELGDWLRADDGRAAPSRRKRGRARPGSRRPSSVGARLWSRIPSPPSCSISYRTSSTRLAPPRKQSPRLSS